MIAVHPVHQRQGIGTRLAQCATQAAYARSNGCSLASPANRDMRHRRLELAISRMPRVRLVAPDAAFYALVDVSEVLTARDGSLDDEALTRTLPSGTVWGVIADIHAWPLCRSPS
jgi:hypothetical protein